MRSKIVAAPLGFRVRGKGPHLKTDFLSLQRVQKTFTSGMEIQFLLLRKKLFSPSVLNFKNGKTTKNEFL